MKRFLLPAAMAFGLHGLVLGMDPQWITHDPLKWKPPAPVSITLSYIEPEKPPEPEVIKTASPPAVAEPKPKPAIQPPHPIKQARPIEKRKTPPPVWKAAKPEPSPEPEIVVPEDTTETGKVTPDPPEENTATTLAALPPAPLHVATPEPARPLYRENPPPRYPRIARKRGYQGTVVLEVLVDQEGDVEDLKVYRSSGYKALDRAALSSVRHWSFTPGQRGEVVVDMWVRVPIAFRLTE